MPPENLLDPTSIDLTRVIAGKEEIRAANPQRFEMEHLDAICMVDADRKLAAGYKDVRDDEFWCRGHMPGNPILPGVIMCEAAAQLCSYYITRHTDLIGPGRFVGFGGLEDVRFRTVVRPGERLVFVGFAEKLKRAVSYFKVQGFVGAQMAFHATVIGVPMPSGGG